VSNKFGIAIPVRCRRADISFGGNNKVTAIETVIEIFNQSIVILKDDAVTHDPESVRKDVVRMMIKSNPKIVNAYEVLMEGASVEEQHTNIRKLS